MELPSMTTGSESATNGERPESPATLTFDDLIFQQELNEVYLLLDFISGRPDKHLSDLEGKMVDRSTSTTMSMTAILERVSLLRYPPQTAEPKKAQDAAFLLTLKDALNSLAYPARGLTIAYTIMFTEGYDGWGMRNLASMARRQKGKTENRSRPGASRIQAAELAYPGLKPSAASFRRVKNIFSWIGLLVTISSAVLLWQITYGVQLTARFEQAKVLERQSESTLYGQLDKELAASTAISLQLADYCKMLPTYGLKPGAGNDIHVSTTTREECNDYAFQHAVLGVAISDVGAYSQSWIFQMSNFLLPVHSFRSTAGNNPDATKQADEEQVRGRQEDAPSVANVLLTMANYILPILFGLIGTMAALVRTIQDKVTESVLAPRDQALALIRLPLGMMAGICVGLFFNPNMITTQAGLGGALTLSASGIAFLAGYGAEGFFRMLDLLITRVFSLESTPRSTRSP
jgi:hypothetical protein